MKLGGGTGFIGTHLSNLLKNSGYNVVTISRMPGLQRITWHELNEKGLPDDTFAAINVAGQNVLEPTRRWTDGFKQNVWSSRVNTTSSLVEAITKAKSKPEVFVNISGVSSYRPSADKIYTEDDKAEEFDYLSKLNVHWEKAAELPPSENVRLVRRLCMTFYFFFHIDVAFNLILLIFYFRFLSILRHAFALELLSVAMVE